MKTLRARGLLWGVVLLGVGAVASAGCSEAQSKTHDSPSAPAAAAANAGTGAIASSSGTGGASAPSTHANDAGSGARPAQTQPTHASDAASDAGSGAHGDAGTPTDDAAVPSMAAGTGCAASMVCDSFETGGAAELDPGAWTIGATNCSGTGEVAIDSEVAHSGARSVRVRGAGGYCNHVFFAPKLSGAALPDPLYGRFFVRFDMPLSAAHVTFLALHDANEDKDLRMGGQSEVLMWNRESDDATLPELSPTGIAASVKPIAGSWLCVEFAIATQAAELHTFIDEKPIAALSVEGDPTPDGDAQWQRKADWRPKPVDVRLGWESYGDQANTLWFDDVAVGGARIGCEI